MPTVRIELEDVEIRRAIKKLGMGYGFQLDRRYPIWLTVPDTKAPRRGQFYPRKPLAPITEAKYSRIRKYAENARQAALQVVELSHGRLTDPDLPGEHATESGGSPLDTDTIKAVVASAAANEVAQQLAPLRAELAQKDEKLEDLKRENASLRERAAKLLGKGGKGKKGKGKREPEPEFEPPVLPQGVGASAADLEL